MQKPVKKQIDKKLNKSSLETVKPIKLTDKQKLKLAKTNKIKEKILKTMNIDRRIFANLVSGRPFRNYQINKKNKLLNLNVRVAPNNVFCSLKDHNKNMVLSSVSAGSYKLNVSKKGVRHYSKQIVRSFLKGLRDKHIHFNRPLVTKIIAPFNLRRPILDIFKNSLYKKFSSKSTLLIDIPAKKVFNGCRPSKKIRKKRKGLRLFK